MLDVVLDVSFLIPCCAKSEEDKRGIRKLGDVLNDMEVTLYLSRRLIRVYRTKIRSEVDRCKCHPLPRFHASFLRVLDHLVRVSYTRSALCNSKKLGKTRIWYHILERSRVERYDVTDIGLDSEEDREIIRVALAATRFTNNVFVVTVDYHFFMQLDLDGLRRKYEHAERINVIKPQDLLQDLTS